MVKKILKVFLTVLLISSIAPVVSAAEPIGGNYFHPDYETKDKVLEAGKQLNEEIYGEGVVLLKNDNSLPLREGAKISLFGKNSLNVLKSGSGSSSGSGSANVSMLKALQDAGFQINPELINFYNNSSLSGSGRGTAPSNGNVPSGYQTGETPVSMYGPVESSYANYNEAALVVFSRISGEGFDLPRTMSWNGSGFGTWSTDQLVPGARSKDDHYLQLDKNESDLLKYLGDRFENVIVLLNTGSQFEVGFLDDPTHYGYHKNIKGALWIGYPGGNGLTALGKVLKGEINPSGKTVDTFARDFKEDPTWMNFGNNLVNFGNQYENLPSSSGHGGGGYRNNYVYYQEGIYVGYRYYETRGFTDGEEWYQDHVVYPFGHGLSYTTFTQEIVDYSPKGVIDADDEITVTVKVTNTGTVAGKEVVQIYYTSPYINGGIEKSHVVLGEFGKTKSLKPNESEEITLKFKARDMASYDFNDANKNGFKGYEMDAGNYQIRLMKNAHEEFESFTVSVADNIKLTTDDNTGNAVANRFDDVSNEITNYLSRSDWEGTFPTTYLKITASEAIKQQLVEWLSTFPSDEGKPYYSSTTPKTGNDTGSVKLNDLIGLDYNDPLWDTFMDQLSVSTLRALVGNGSYRSGMDLPALGITQAVNADSPAGWVNWSYGTSGSINTLYCSDVILASTYNKELAYKKGLLIGNEALFGNGGSKSRYAGWYAPAVNIHRSPFGGRNFEYFSEDGFLTGIMAAQIVKGVQEKGVFPYVKHFGVNEQETYRVGLLTWASEQSMREIYLKGFELTVKVGKTRGIMSALNRIGTTWAGGSYALLTELLRNEWGFKGMVVTDSYLGGYSNIDQMIRAGGDLTLGSASISYNSNSPTTITNLRRAAKNLLYTHANSLAMNTGYSTLPQALSVYNGTLLDTAISGVDYRADIATVKLNPELFGENPDHSLIEYRLKDGSTLPDGLTLSLSGIISGTPSVEVNNHQFTVVASYENYFREATFTLTVGASSGTILYPNQTLGIFIANKPVQVDVAKAYIFKPDATPSEIENFPKITYSLKDGHLLPEGLQLVNGVLTGTPRKVIKDYKVVIVASALGFRDSETTLTINIYNEITFEGGTLQNGKFGTRYLDQINSVEGITYALKNGNSLPKGLSLTPGGLIVGVPTEVVQNYSFIIVASRDFCEDVEATYTISIGISYNKTTLQSGVVDQEYDTMINTAQGVKNIRYSSSNLPEGLTLSSDGTLSGTPTKAGIYTITVDAQADGYLGDTMQFTLFIDNAPRRGLFSCNNADTGLFMASIISLASILFIYRKRGNL